MDSVVVDYACHTGECPIWHPGEGAVYWEDIPYGRLYRYRPDTGDHECCFEGDALRGFTVQEDDGLLLFFENGAVRHWDGDATTTVRGPNPAVRFNDVIADPRGRVFCGSMPTDDHPGRLHRLDTDGSLTTVDAGFDLPNGMGFTPDRESLYFTDSHGNTVYRFAYDAETGELSDREVFVDTTEDRGAPDGLTVDAEGFVWSARWNGGGVVRYTPTGDRERRVEFPARKVTSLTFGGPDCETAYLTTARGAAASPPGAREDEGPGAGALFRADLGVAGRPEFRSSVFPYR